MKGKPLPEYRLPDVRTLYDVLHKGLEISGRIFLTDYDKAKYIRAWSFLIKGNGPCLGERQGKNEGPYSWIKYSEVRILKKI